MEPSHAGGGGGPAPFLLKTYEMVDDSSTNDVVSWSDTGASFVVWNPPDFAAKLLPMYFKHNNFSSFIRQLNTYGFRKSDPEKWEFSNDHFIKGQKQLLKSIHRRKPIHSHTQPAGVPQSFSDRTVLEEQIDRLSRERTALQSELVRFKHQQSGARIQIEDIERRIHDMEQRQLKMVAFLHKAMANPKFMDNLLKFANGLSGPNYQPVIPVSLPDSTHLKKRRQTEYSPELLENNCSSYEDHCSSSDKLRLELCPAMAAMSTQSSNEEIEQHIDSGTITSLCPLKTVLDSDHLDLTLASCSNPDIEKNDDNTHDLIQDENNGDGNEESEENVGPPARVNDVFWEQFLTDKPECEPNPSPSKDMEGLKL